MTGILSGMRIVEASAFVAAPYAGMVLAEMGADVIRIDPVGGGLDKDRWPLAPSGRSLYWAGLNKGKRSILLDVRSHEGREIAHELMTLPGDDSGFVLTNLPARGWLDFETLKARREDLVMVNLLGNRDGSVALDYTVNAAAGFPMNQGPVDEKGPINNLLPAWDFNAGVMAANGLLAADRYRRKTGEGQFIQLALADAAFHVMSALGYTAEVEINKIKRPKTGNHVWGTFSHVFQTKDGRYLVVTAFTPRHWKNLVTSFDLAETVAKMESESGLDLYQEANRWAMRDDIVDMLRPLIAARTLNEMRSLFEEHGVCWGPYQTFEQAVHEDPRVSEENPMFSRVVHPNIGEYLTPGSILDFSAVPRVPPGEAPVHGQHTEQILAEVLSLSKSEIGKLVDKKIVGLG